MRVIATAQNQFPSTERKYTVKTDAQVQQDVIAELKWEPSVNATDIGVEVKGGVVTLAGHVDSFAAKWNAERAAQRVSGVQALAVEMDVKLSGSAKRSDADIARSVENTLQWTVYLPKDAVKVMVENGWVTLSGQVDWAYQRDSAAQAVRYLMGVTGLSNDIGLKVSVSPGSVKSDIEAALKRRAHSDTNDISIEVHGTDVTLAGKVHSWSERNLARDAAWCTPGVRSVTNNITIAY